MRSVDPAVSVEEVNSAARVMGYVGLFLCGMEWYAADFFYHGGLMGNKGIACSRSLLCILFILVTLFDACYARQQKAVQLLASFSFVAGALLITASD